MSMEREPFLNETVHALRGPLNNLLLAAELLDADNLDAGQKGALQTIRDGVAELTAVIERLERHADGSGEDR